MTPYNRPTHLQLFINAFYHRPIHIGTHDKHAWWTLAAKKILIDIQHDLSLSSHQPLAIPQHLDREMFIHVFRSVQSNTRHAAGATISISRFSALGSVWFTNVQRDFDSCKLESGAVISHWQKVWDFRSVLSVSLWNHPSPIVVDRYGPWSTSRDLSHEGQIQTTRDMKPDITAPC